ncbi:MAG: [protein-PII] uridylyltransferase, partial [Gammaproteobacteria bacterium]|nr:[protein-PII] uridylyltransferase [Gammaproteobacteria bacterium]
MITEIFNLAVNEATADAPFQISAVRSRLATVQDALAEAFAKGADIESLVATRSAVIDHLLISLWHQLTDHQWQEHALVAVGGYGRGELHPHSDIDILILLRQEPTSAQQEVIQHFFTSLWDLKLDVGHSVRTLDECVTLADQEITVATNLMESRLLCGNSPLFNEMNRRTCRDQIWPGEAFFQAKCEEQRDRYTKYNDTAFNLEPNIKEGPGGLRDIQTIGWVAKRHFDAKTLEELVHHNFLTSDELEDLLTGQCFLWRVRYALHLISGRKEERLLFDHQRKIATRFGYKDSASHLAVELFMKEYYRTITHLQRLNEMLLQLFQEEFFTSNNRQLEPVAVNNRFQNNNDYLEVVHDDIFRRYPFALMEIFLLLSTHPEIKGVRAGTIRLIRSHLHHINQKFRSDLRNTALFIELFKQPYGLTHTLRRMNRYGVLAAYIPEFAKIVGQMQHDLFHVYTVDEHTLRVIRNIRRFTVTKYANEHPLARDILRRLPKPELIYIAALFHDIGKGRGGNHSTIGAAIAAEFCQRHHLSQYDTRLVAWLVEHHLLMSTTAQRKDINDPDVINQFAEKVGDETYLNYLFLITINDIQATGPTIWNSWKESLLTSLFYATEHALRRGLGNKVTQQELISSTKSEVIEGLHLMLGTDQEQVEQLWQNYSDDYFLRYPAAAILWHTPALIAHEKGREQPLVLVRQGKRGGTSIFIHTPVRNGLFADVTAILDQLCLDIVDARILSTGDRWSLDTFIVLESDGNPITLPHRTAEIRSRIEEMLRGEITPPASFCRAISRQMKSFNIRTTVSFTQDEEHHRTIMEVVTSDRPGLLSRIGRTLAEHEITITSAKIATLGERVEDTFFITDHLGVALSATPRLENLRKTLIAAIHN